MVSNNDIIMQSLGDENIAKPILIKDDNLIIKPNEEPVPHRGCRHWNWRCWCNCLYAVIDHIQCTRNHSLI
jgi:hypothetical protein